MAVPPCLRAGCAGLNVLARASAPNVADNVITISAGSIAAIILASFVLIESIVIWYLCRRGSGGRSRR